MITEPRRVAIRLDADGRLIAAVTAAIGYLAAGSGMGESAVSNFRAAAASACREAFSLVKDEPLPLEVVILCYPDRMVVEFIHRGSSGPAIGLDALAGIGSTAKNPFLTGGVDRVEYESKGQLSVTRLTKFLKASAPAA